MTIYMKRNGVMLFWRVGRIGGSFYLAKSKVQQPKLADPFKGSIVSRLTPAYRSNWPVGEWRFN